MPDEIAIKLKLSFDKGESSASIPVQDFTDTMTGTNHVKASQTIAFAAPENLAKGDIGTVGWLWVKNKDDTNFVKVGYDDGGFRSDVIVKPLKQVLFYSGQAQPKLQADTGNVAIDFFAVEV